jgi:hypothetical protein
MSWRESAVVGFLMSTRGLVELIVLNVGLEKGILNVEVTIWQNGSQLADAVWSGVHDHGHDGFGHNFDHCAYCRAHLPA